jgi:hypothetical protein
VHEKKKQKGGRRKDRKYEGSEGKRGSRRGKKKEE